MAKCVACGDEFQPRRGTRRIKCLKCSPERLGPKRTPLAPKGAEVSAECGRCGVSFTYAYLRPRQLCDGCRAQPRQVECPACGRIRAGTNSAHVCHDCYLAAVRRPVPLVECGICGSQFRPTSGRKLFCSRSCANRRHAKWPPLAGRVCEVCGVIYTAGTGQQRTCGRTCGEVLASASRRISRPGAEIWRWRSILAVCHCSHCGSGFIARRERKFCTKSCSRKDRTARRPRLNEKGSAVEAECRKCGCSFSYTYRGISRRFCDACRKAADAAANNSPSNHRKRARKYGVAYEPINRKRLFERDGWRCYLCGVKVHLFRGDRSDPRLASIDHVVAISNGGSHTWDNVRTACMRCNRNKSDVEIDVQLHMI